MADVVSEAYSKNVRSLMRDKAADVANEISNKTMMMMYHRLTQTVVALLNKSDDIHKYDVVEFEALLEDIGADDEIRYNFQQKFEQLIIETILMMFETADEMFEINENE